MFSTSEASEGKLTAVLELSELYGTPIYILKGGDTRLKQVYGAVYYGKTIKRTIVSEWRFPAFWPVHKLVIDDLHKTIPGLTLSEEVIAHNASLENYTFPKNYSHITTPYTHQQEGLEHIHRNLRAGLFYSPGLGKCKMTVDLQVLTQDPMLILCPKVMLDTWAEEFEKHGNVTDVVILAGTKKKREKIVAAAIKKAPAALMVTYKTAHNDLDELIKVEYKCIVVDESHCMKSPFAQRTVSMTKLASRAYRRILLSGTPSLGSPYDLYAQLRFLGKYFCPEAWWSFRKKFGVFPKHEQDEAIPKMLLGYKNLTIINTRVNLICSSRTKDECLDLPEQTIIDRVFAVSSAQKKAYNNLIKERCDPVGFGVRDDIENERINYTTGPVLPAHVIVNEPIALLGKLDQIISGFVHQTTRNPRLCDTCPNVKDCVANNIQPYTAKCEVVKKSPESVIDEIAKNARIEELEALLESILEDKENKVIVWARYKRELEQLEKLVKGFPCEYVRIDGGTSVDELRERKAAFNTDPECRVYLGQVSTGVGLTLNAANYVIYHNLPWSLEHYLQSLDRNYRIGQTRKVTVYRLIAKHTLDEAKAAALDQKIDFSNLITNNAVCATCPEFKKRCAKHHIALYDPECIYDFSMARQVAQVRLIP